MPTAPHVDLYSSGGGKQSTAMLVLIATGHLPNAPMVMSNVGDRAERPAVLTYFAEVARPYAADHGIELVMRRWVDRTGRERDLYDDVMAATRTIDIPVRLASGAFGNRKCTERYKIDVVARDARARGATAEHPWAVAIGISTDEIQRAKVGIDKHHPWVTRVNPLLDLGLSRADCERVVADAGLPPAPKSACYFCPFQTTEQWRRLRSSEPEQWAQAVALEKRVNETRAELGRDWAGLASGTVPLEEAIDQQGALDDDCDGGWCWT